MTSSVAMIVGFVLSVCFATTSYAGDAKSAFSARAERAYLTNRIRFQNEKTNAATAWQFGRACFDWAEFAANDDRREEIANQGIAACRRSVALHPALAAAHYYLALNLGQFARTKTFGALKVIHEMEHALKKAIELDEKFDFAGPHRSLGLLYSEAPGWPVSIGNRSKARLHLERAVELSPEMPENRLCLAEYYAKWNDTKDLVRELKALKELLPKARKAFTGDAWAVSWDDWDKRWKKLEDKRSGSHPGAAYLRTTD